VTRFKLRAGSEVQVKDRRDGWLRIALPDVGRSGVRGGGGAVAACSGVCVTSTGRLGREGRPAGGLGRPGQDSSRLRPEGPLSTGPSWAGSRPGGGCCRGAQAPSRERSSNRLLSLTAPGETALEQRQDLVA